MKENLWTACTKFLFSTCFFFFFWECIMQTASNRWGVGDSPHGPRLLSHFTINIYYYFFSFHLEESTPPLKISRSAPVMNILHHYQCYHHQRALESYHVYCAVTTSFLDQFCLLLLHHFAVTTSSRHFSALISWKYTLLYLD